MKPNKTTIFQNIALRAGLYFLFLLLVRWILGHFFVFANKTHFYLAALVLAVWIGYRSFKKGGHFFVFSSKTLFSAAWFSPYLWSFFLQSLGLTALVLAIGRPQLQNEYWDEAKREGIEIMLALDMSGSMLAMDFSPNRLEAAKEVTMQFVLGRRQDQIGLVLFEGQAYLQCPLTSDHQTLIRLFKAANTGKVQPGTAIGAALATALNGLRSGKAKTKIVILVTDGVNEAPSQISPELALEMAKTLGIRIYTIGVGTNGRAPFPATDMFGNKTYQEIEVKIDEELLQLMSQETGGKYYRATDEKALKDIYKEIDALEKDKLQVLQKIRIPEKFYWFLMTALLAFLLEFLSRRIIFKSIHL